MNPVTQQDQLGCSAACISFIAQKNYVEVVSLLGKEHANSRGFYCKDLIAVLATLGFSYSYKYIKPRLKNRIYQDGAIVFIRKSKNCPDGHYLTRFEGQWMDPWINFPKDNNVNNARSGFRKRLPGKPIYILFPN